MMSWISEDITFCPLTCNNISCMRNKDNIRDRTIPHSYSTDIPDDCPNRTKNFKEILHPVSVDEALNVLERNGWVLCTYNDTPFAVVKHKIGSPLDMEGF